MSQFDGLQAGEQPALLFVEQAVEKQNRGFQLIGRYLQSGSISRQRNRLGGLPGAELVASLATIDGGVQETSGHLRAAQTFGAHQIVEGVLDLDMEDVGQFVSEPTVRGLIDEGFDGGNQSPVTGKPNSILRPQPCSLNSP